jgi:hypothetical protein
LTGLIDNPAADLADNRSPRSNLRRVKLRMPELVFLFLLGAVASLVGDHSHVATGTTEYLTDAVPFVWSSPIWFPLLVAVATVSLAELRLHLPAPRTSVTARQGLAGVPAVIGIYVTTALVHTAPAVPATVLIYALAAITWCVLGDGPGAVCGVLAAIGGPIVEAVLAWTGVFRYADDSDALFGVGPWLPALYFAFGVVVALLAEIAAKDRQPSIRSSDPGIPASR